MMSANQNGFYGTNDMGFVEWLNFTFNSGKNPKWIYYLKAYLRQCVPNIFFQARLEDILKNAYKRSDIDLINDRVDYYCRLSSADWFDKNNKCFTSICNLPKTKQKVYWFDAMEYLRWFNPDLNVSLLSGDIYYIPSTPQIVKSRPIGNNNQNSVLLNMDKVRHFIFINDKMTFREKKDIALFRGKIGNPDSGHTKQSRWDLLNKYFGHPLMDLGEVASKRDSPNLKWLTKKLTIYQQLKNKFILCIEGNDVASNLKWVMSSNSVAVMPRPTCETWFMEGRLKPMYHYIEVDADFNDLPEKINYYISHPEEAEQIIKHAHEYVDQFRNKHREDIISLMTLNKYINIINQ